MAETSWKRSDFHFELPDHFIAQEPASPRDSSKLMVINRAEQTISHHIFHELPSLLPEHTILVRNNSKVIRARLKGTLTSGKECELFFLEERSKKSGLFLVRPGKKFKEGELVTVTFGEQEVQIQVRQITEDGARELVFMTIETSLLTFLDQMGELPLPPYIEKQDPNSEEERYQTSYAKHEGSVAAPTAGLHFTPEVDKELHGKGIHTKELTLHVGAGTFLPVKSDDVKDHIMHAERYAVGRELFLELLEAKKQGHPLLSVGTTSTRTLEHLFHTVIDDKGALTDNSDPLTGSTDIFIYPPFEFKAVDMLLTNFHLPESTLIMLVSAFIGDLDFTLKAYEEAKSNNYRFYSYGDSMLII